MSHWKRKAQTLNTIGVSCKVLGTAGKDVEKFIQTVCYSGKKRIESYWNKVLIV